MAEKSITDRNASLAALMGARLGMRGGSLGDKLRRGGRHLPRRLRAQAAYLAEVESMSAHPRLARQADPVRIRQAEGDLRRYLRSVDPWDRRKGLILNVLAALSFNLLLLFGAAVAVMSWKGVL
ncbi:hypothetical protein RM543_16380 [Roseicyclus sp. F158]|uniref:Uncharacterized protein n=1 Tax=Tropicimonas omnivorans TaxID=3075590 RepID=A0ABU3DKM6_9RHOB|nr:hypothetical protein [Roseicyclus sp. F158]MDT0684263.1 hypothetical protein [Roseicyclus sp. F158]